MQILVRSRILSIVNTLKKAQKNRLADCIEKNWNKTALDYSKELNSWQPAGPIEKELLDAFDKELERLEYPAYIKKEILESLERRRVLQTGPHLSATETPRFFCINWLGSLGVEEKDFYVVGMFSGIPFSNHTRPGRINKKVESINLFPSALQDALVYQSTITPKLVEAISELPPDFARYLPEAKVGDSYTKWALGACQHIERKILKKNNLVFLDINEVVTDYLIKVLTKPAHPFHKIFFDRNARAEFIKVLPNEIIFYGTVVDGKYKQMENFFFTSSGESLKSRNPEISLASPGVLIEELREGRLCPALILSFLALAFLNQFKCLGSFAQVEYLPVYQEKLSKLSFLKELKIEKVPTSNLTTGTFPDGKDLYPVDIIMGKLKFKPNTKILFGELLLNMKKVLLESYFTGDSRINGKK